MLTIRLVSIQRNIDSDVYYIKFDNETFTSYTNYFYEKKKYFCLLFKQLKIKDLKTNNIISIK